MYSSPLSLSLSLPRSFSLKWDTSRSFMSWSLLSLPSVRKTQLYHLISFVITAITLALGYTLMLLRKQRSFLSTACKRLPVRQIRRPPVFNRPILARSTIRSDKNRDWRWHGDLCSKLYQEILLWDFNGHGITEHLENNRRWEKCIEMDDRIGESMMIWQKIPQSNG